MVHIVFDDYLGHTEICLWYYFKQWLENLKMEDPESRLGERQSILIRLVLD